MRLSTAGIAAALLGLAMGMGTRQLDPVVNMCVRFNHQSTVKNKTLYIDGGIQTFMNNVSNSSRDNTGNITLGFNEYLIAIDLSASWDWKTNISETALKKTSNPTTGSTVPSLVRGALYQGAANDSNIYLYGGTTSYINTSFPGWQPPSPSTYSLWSYNTVSKKWDQFDTTSASPYRPNSGAYTEAPDQGLAFYFNGEIDSGSSTATQVLGDFVKIFLTGMIVIDTSQHTVRNLSTNAVSGDQPRTRGRLQYVPGIGEKGILVSFGGSQKQVTELDNMEVGNLVAMDEIDVFDIASLYNASTPDGTWFKQIASGNIPGRRVDFCLIVASAPDSSSHNIYMYGGRGLASQHFDDIHVLSLPSFTWTKVYSGESARFGHTCHLVGNRTMLTVGGAATVANKFAPCDWQLKGVGVFDISTLIWGSVYDMNAPAYEVPAQVISTIGGSKIGNATLKGPSPGFSQAGLAKLFGVVTPDSASPTSSSNTGSIIGGVIAGVAGLVILIGAAWLFWYYKHIKKPDGKVIGPFELDTTPGQID